MQSQVDIKEGRIRIKNVERRHERSWSGRQNTGAHDPR